MTAARTVTVYHHITLGKGYWQVPLAEEDKEKTVFTSPLGLLQFRVTPFGLSRVPATFQRLMDTMLWGSEEIHLDDVVIYGTEWGEHLQNIETVFQKLQKAGLTLKLKKCSFGMESCTYLGHQIGKGGVCIREVKERSHVLCDAQESRF